MPKRRRNKVQKDPHGLIDQFSLALTHYDRLITRAINHRRWSQFSISAIDYHIGYVFILSSISSGSVKYSCSTPLSSFTDVDSIGLPRPLTRSRMILLSGTDTHRLLVAEQLGQTVVSIQYKGERARQILTHQFESIIAHLWHIR